MSRRKEGKGENRENAKTINVPRPGAQTETHNRDITAQKHLQGLKTGLDVLKWGFVGTGWLSEPRVDSGGTSALVLPPFSGLEDSWFNQETE